ncbi:MAG: gamma-glutamyl-phosphate reductase, partial [Candidatus Omnitrophica bacterium]|nr:gamma-glutamyl-phosphate reductase [Candidatus Omnitrophota bacterium]
MSLHAEIEAIARRAQQASAFCAVATSEQKNKAIEAMARGLESQAPVILKANQLDVECAAAENNSSAFIDRLRLTEQRIKKMSDDLRAIVALPDPVGEMIKMWRRPNGLMIGKMRVQIG